MKKITIFVIVIAIAILAAAVAVYVYVIRDSGPITSVTDCQGHTYPVVKIGEQYWMAENLQCTKYDTKSERAGEILHTSDTLTFAPYYTDGRMKSNWSKDSKKCSELLKEEYIKEMGLLYNWTAAMGYENMHEIENQTDEYWEYRQGICPNGWHMPSRADWNILVETIGGVPERDFGLETIPNIGTFLQTNCGWHEGGCGSNDTGFSAFPAGCAQGNDVRDVGTMTFFWTANSFHGVYIYYIYLNCYSTDLREMFDWEGVARSVRCVKDL